VIWCLVHVALKAGSCDNAVVVSQLMVCNLATKLLGYSR
jgi:hypothetical protein